ncbi:MAG: tRNA pseudouridine(55) synthase TruB [Pseudoclavibacter sp.]
MSRSLPAPHGILVVDKPCGPSSHGVVSAARKALGTRKIGHAGTLDPMATGVLVLGVGAATRLLTFIVGADKDYEATMRLGVRTNTEDAAGEVTAVTSPELLATVDEASIDRAIAALVGEIEQVPSAVSAIKIDGKRAYQRVRDGEDVELASRRVTVSTFERTAAPTRASADDPDAPGAIDVRVRVTCSSGTYVRALARDVGDALGVGAHLTALRRTRVGSFGGSEAVALDALAETGTERLITPADAARRIMPGLELTAAEATDLGHGKRVPRHADQGPVGPAAAFGPDGRLVGVVEHDGAAYRTVMNLPEGLA